MLINLKNNLHWIALGAGLIFHCALLFNSMFPWSIVWLLFTIYSWLIISIIIQQYSFKHFLYLLCISGIWVSLIWFFINGIEEVPLPRGAFLFKPEGLITSIILFILFTTPLIIYTFGSQIKMPSISNSLAIGRKKEKDLPINTDNEKWEEATIEDVESGKFDII
tara:strand:- start:234 stop:728 length:495 start_codon:yes stop_codon:yes gene_type:complete